VAVVAVAAVVAGAEYGWRPLRDRLPGYTSKALLVLALLGLFLALWTSVPWGATTLEGWTSWPATGLLRDAQKFVALWALPLSLLVAMAAERLAGRIVDPSGRRAVVAGVCLLPLVLLPDLVGGVAGRLRPVDLPEGWSRVRAAIQDSGLPGDAVVLPWGSFRQFGFNGGRTSLDPAPRWLPVPSVVDTRLVVESGGGATVQASETARSAAVTTLLEQNPGDTSERLAALGIGWIVIERDTPGVVPSVAASAGTVVYDDPAVQLRRIEPSGVGPGWGRGSVVVLVVDAAVAVVWLSSALIVVRRRRPVATVAPRDKEEGP
jgi:hypothetical protein